MPVPTIDPESSVLAYPQWLHWEHTFSATNAPTAWGIASGGFPSGMEFQPLLPCTGAATGDLITCDGHDFTAGAVVVLDSKTGGAGLATGTRYFVRDVDGITFALSATLGGAAIDITTDMTDGMIYRLGHLVGAATAPGISTVRLVATNGTGDSAEVLFTIGIEPAALSPDANDDLVWNIGTGDVIPQTESVVDLTPLAPDVPLMIVKEGDDLLARLRILKSGTPLDLPATELRLVLKELEPENEIVVSSAFVKEGTGTNTSYLLYAQFAGPALAASLSNYEADKGTAYNGLAEFEITFSNAEAIGPATLVKSTKTFRLRVERDIANN